MSKLKYYDPVDGEWKPVYSEAGSNSIVTGEIPSGDIDSSNDEFTTSQAYLPGTLEVFVNGLRQVVNVHYTETSPLSGVFTFDEPPLTGDNITVNYMMSITTTGNADTLDGYHLSAILEAIYPVGSIYVGSDDGTMPALIASIGTWVRLEGRVIVGVDDGDSDFDYDDTGGFKSTRHGFIAPPSNSGNFQDSGSNYMTAAQSRLKSWLEGDGSSTWDGINVSVQNVGGTIRTNGTTATEVRHGRYTSSNLPPFKAKYMWERVA